MYFTMNNRLGDFYFYFLSMGSEGIGSHQMQKPKKHFIDFLVICADVLPVTGHFQENRNAAGGTTSK